MCIILDSLTKKTINLLDYPYYIVPAVEEYKSLPHDSEKAKALSRIISANIGDYHTLRLILGIDPPEFARFYPDLELSSPSTNATIDSFLDKYGSDTPLGYVPDPVSEENPIENEKDPEAEENHFQNLMKQHQFHKALEFIEHQNLINPKKSIYFAHQIRFLKKLIAIENYKNNNKGT